MSFKVLAVEDSEQFQKMIEASFKTESEYELAYAKSSDEAIKHLEAQHFDIFIIDVGLPDMDGFQLCSFIKSHPKYTSTPVIFLTGHDQIEDKEKGFAIGGNDYLTKPFHVRELLLRVRSLTKSNSNSSSSSLKVGDLVLNIESHRVHHIETQKELSLTKTEFQLLALLGRNVDRVISRERILDTIWPDKLDVSERTVDSHMSNLRKKVSDCGITITSIHSSGYRLNLSKSEEKAS